MRGSPVTTTTTTTTTRGSAIAGPELPAIIPTAASAPFLTCPIPIRPPSMNSMTPSMASHQCDGNNNGDGASGWDQVGKERSCSSLLVFCSLILNSLHRPRRSVLTAVSPPLQCGVVDIRTQGLFALLTLSHPFAQTDSEPRLACRLCNACGLRWSRNKRKSGVDDQTSARRTRSHRKKTQPDSERAGLEGEGGAAAQPADPVVRQ